MVTHGHERFAAEGGRLLVKGAVSDELGHRSGCGATPIPQLCLSFSSIPHPRKPFPTRFTFVLRFNLVQVYEATVDST